MEDYAKYGIFVIAILVLSAVAISVKPDILGPKNAKVAIPAYAVEVSPGVYSLGTAVHGGRLVEGYAIVDYKESPAKPTRCNYDGVCQKSENPSCADCAGVQDTSCYGFLSRGARWKSAEPYVFNPKNSYGIDESLAAQVLDASIAKWENAASAGMIGAGSVTSETLEADMISPDNKNEVYFGSIDSPNAIAITIVWGNFKGPSFGRELVEWDQVYDQEDYPWSVNNASNAMDFENIVTHELGHTVGLDDLYTSGCVDETMYGYADYGETKKRDLGPGDIAGVKLLYG